MKGTRGNILLLFIVLSVARGPVNKGELTTDLLKGELVGVTVHVLTGGGVSDGRLPPGGVPNTNWT